MKHGRDNYIPQWAPWVSPEDDVPPADLPEHMTRDEALRWSRRELWRGIASACIPLAVIVAIWVVVYLA